MRLCRTFIAAILLLQAIHTAARGQANPGPTGAGPAAGGGPAGVSGVGPLHGNGVSGVTGAGPLYGNGVAGVPGAGPGQAPRRQMNVPAPPGMFGPTMGAVGTVSPTTVNSLQTAPTGASNLSTPFQASPAFGSQVPQYGTNTVNGSASRTPFSSTSPGSPAPTATMSMYSGATTGAGVNIGTSNAGASGTIAQSGVNGPPLAGQVRPNSNPDPNAWRLVNQSGQWWYWAPGNFWMYYQGGAWSRYNPDIGLAPA